MGRHGSRGVIAKSTGHDREGHGRTVISVGIVQQSCRKTVLHNSLENDDDLQKYIILLADANNEPINGKTKLQKMMFLLSDKLDKVKEQSSYDASHYGPYSEIIDAEYQYLEQIGVLSTSAGKIKITDTGREIAKEFVKRKENILRVLEEYKKLLNDLDTEELLTYIYLAYPDMIVESAAYEHLKPQMEHHLLSLIKKQKITAQRAAELLGRTQTYVLEKMSKQGIVVLGA